MPSIIEVDIPILPPTPNQTRGQHWSKAKRTRDQIGLVVHTAWHAAKPKDASHLGLPATIDIIVHAHGRPADSDNQWARCKPVIDGLVQAGAIVDDSPKWLHLGTITHAKAPPRQGHLRIRITYHHNEKEEAS